MNEEEDVPVEKWKSKIKTRVLQQQKEINMEFFFYKIYKISKEMMTRKLYQIYFLRQILKRIFQLIKDKLFTQIAFLVSTSTEFSPNKWSAISEKEPRFRKCAFCSWINKEVLIEEIEFYLLRVLFPPLLYYCLRNCEEYGKVKHGSCFKKSC